MARWHILFFNTFWGFFHNFPGLDFWKLRSNFIYCSFGGQMERWAESVKDYEVLRKELPGDTEVAEAYFHAQVALKSSRGEEVSNMKFGGEVEAIIGMEQFQMATSLPG